jgi:Holliday junction resolvasome RuvABC endonuclease subunit
MSVFGIDPGDHTGIAIVDKGKVIFTTEIIYSQKKKLKHMEELLYLEAIRKIYREFKPDLVVIESSFMGKFVAIIQALTKKFVIITLAIKMEFPEALIIKSPPSEWKALLQIPQKTRMNQTPEKEKVLSKLQELIPGYISQGEHVDDAISMCFAYEGKVRIKSCHS